MTKDFYLLGEAARALGCKPYQITYAITTRQVPEPKRIGGRRMFSQRDLKVLAKKLNLACNVEQERRRDEQI